MATLFEDLIAAGLPVESASDEAGVHIMPGVILTMAQAVRLGEIVMAHQDAAAYAEYTTYRTLQQQIRDEYANAITTLGGIQAKVNPTNAEVIAAVKYEAKVLERLLKLLKGAYQDIATNISQRL